MFFYLFKKCLKVVIAAGLVMGLLSCGKKGSQSTPPPAAGEKGSAQQSGTVPAAGPGNNSAAGWSASR